MNPVSDEEQGNDADQHRADHELLTRMLAGDEGAFAALYHRRQAAVYRFALQMTGNVVIAEDVTQEVFLELMEHGNRFDPARGALASFLLRRRAKSGARCGGWKKIARRLRFDRCSKTSSKTSRATTTCWAI